MNDSPITIVFSHIAGHTNSEGLKLALRSLRYFRNEHRVVVIGDRPEWMNDDVTVIDHPAVESVQESKMEQLKLAIESDLVTDDFIWMPDNVFFVSPTLLADIIILKTVGEIDPKCGMRRKTVEILKKGGYGTLDFSTYTPYFLSKGGLTELLTEDDVKEVVKELDLISLYFNVVAKGYSALKLDYKTDNIKLSVFSQTPDVTAFKKYVAGKKFLHNLLSSEIVYDYLRKAFPSESEYEK